MKCLFKAYIAIILSLVVTLNSIVFNAVAVDDVSPRGLNIVTTQIEAYRTTMEEGDKQSLRLTASHLGGTMTWSSSSPSVATVDSEGVISAISDGTTTITSRYSYNGAIYTDTITIDVCDKSTVVGIENGRDYYIMNCSGKRLMGLETASNANFTNVHTGARTENTRYQWRTKMNSDGTFKFVSVYSSTNRCLDVTNDNVDIYTDNNGPYLNFTIERVESGTYQGCYLIKHDSQYVAQGANYNVCVTDTLSSSCYWSFMAVEKGYAELFCLNCRIGEALYRSDEHYTYFREACDSAGYFSWSYRNNSAAAAYSCMTSRDDIFVFAGHGGAGVISFNDDDGEDYGMICVNPWYATGDDNRYISNIHDNGLNHARVVLYVGCDTGEDWERSNLAQYNLIDETFEKGAHFVLGIKGAIWTSQVNGLIGFFLDGVAVGKSLNDCIPSVSDINDDLRIGSSDNVVCGSGTNDALSFYVRGDGSQYLDIS